MADLYMDKHTQGSVENLRKYFMLGRHALGWYHDAYALCVELSAKYNISVVVIAALIAVLSPSIRWDYNMVAAKIYLDAFTTGKPQPSVSGYSRNRNKAWLILQTGDVTLVSGLKVLAFFRCIMGFYHDVVVDRHAIRAWLGIEDANGSIKFPKCVNERCADDYRTLANEEGVTPAAAQAAVWVGYKESMAANRKENAA